MKQFIEKCILDYNVSHMEVITYWLCLKYNEAEKNLKIMLSVILSLRRIHY